MMTPTTVKVPSLRKDELERLSPTRRMVTAIEVGPMIAFPGDGRFSLNTAAVATISPKEPLEAVQLFLSRHRGKRYLVVAPAKRAAPDAVLVHQVGLHKGDSKHRGPALVMGRGTHLVLQTLRIVDRVRFRGSHDPKNNWLVFPLEEPLPYTVGGPKDPVGDVIAEWVPTVKKRPMEMRVADLLARLIHIAEEKGLPFLYSKGPATLLSAYLRGHAEELDKKYKLSLRGFGANGVVTLH